MVARRSTDDLARFRPFIKSETEGYYTDAKSGRLVFVRRIVLKDVMQLDEGKRLAQGAQHGTKIYFQRAAVLCAFTSGGGWRNIYGDDRQYYPANTFDRLSYWRPLNLFESLWIRAKHFHGNPIPMWSA